MYVYPYISETHGTKKALHLLAKRLRTKGAPRWEHGTQSIPRDLEKRLFPYRQTAGFLAHGSSPIAFPVSQWPRLRRRMSFSAYSDEIAQALHLFPFYPLPRGQRHRLLFCIQLSVLYPRPIPAVKTKQPVDDTVLSHPQIGPWSSAADDAFWTSFMDTIDVQRPITGCIGNETLYIMRASLT